MSVSEARVGEAFVFQFFFEAHQSEAELLQATGSGVIAEDTCDDFVLLELE
jgi:hypothetical protein